MGCYGRGFLRRMLRRIDGEGVRWRICKQVVELEVVEVDDGAKGGYEVVRGVGGSGSEKDDTDRLSWSWRVTPLRIPREMICQKDEIWRERGLSLVSPRIRRIRRVRKGEVEGPIPLQGLKARG